MHANIARSLYYFATISIILLFWVFWLQYRTLKKFVDTTMGLMKSAEISLIFLKVCWSQYGTQFSVTSIGQVCWHEYVAPCKLIFASWTKSLDIFIFLFHVQNYGKNFIHLSLIYLYKFSIKFFPFDVLEVSSFFQSKISSLYVLRWLWDDKPRLTCKK